jgi:hypothetical protein
MKTEILNRGIIPIFRERSFFEISSGEDVRVQCLSVDYYLVEAVKLFRRGREGKITERGLLPGRGCMYL